MALHGHVTVKGRTHATAVVAVASTAVAVAVAHHDLGHHRVDVAACGGADVAVGPVRRRRLVHKADVARGLREARRLGLGLGLLLGLLVAGAMLHHVLRLAVHHRTHAVLLLLLMVVVVRLVVGGRDGCWGRHVGLSVAMGTVLLLLLLHRRRHDRWWWLQGVLLLGVVVVLEWGALLRLHRLEHVAGPRRGVVEVVVVPAHHGLRRWRAIVVAVMVLVAPVALLLRRLVLLLLLLLLMLLVLGAGVERAVAVAPSGGLHALLDSLGIRRVRALLRGRLLLLLLRRVAPAVLRLGAVLLLRRWRAVLGIHGLVVVAAVAAVALGVAQPGHVVVVPTVAPHGHLAVVAVVRSVVVAHTAVAITGRNVGRATCGRRRVDAALPLHRREGVLRVDVEDDPRHAAVGDGGERRVLGQLVQVRAPRAADAPALQEELAHRTLAVGVLNGRRREHRLRGRLRRGRCRSHAWRRGLLMARLLLLHSCGGYRYGLLVLLLVLLLLVVDVRHHGVAADPR
eukprot:PhM_4_TR3336/c0_g1_i1/m.84131